MIADLSTLDVVALALFLTVWGGYNSLFDGRFRRPESINSKMVAMREVWMANLLRRENRIGDATMIGLTIRTATFFASTTVILIAALVGVLGSISAAGTDTVQMSSLFHATGRALFELKTFVLISVFIYAFFKFTWAIRQFNYFSAVLGSAPYLSPTDVDHGIARRMAEILSHAIWTLNAGVRAYYFAVAALSWFVGPLFFIVTTLLMTVVLVRRQLYSATQRAIADHVQALTTAPPPSPPPPPPQQPPTTER
jgi:uncharacterized membrane protein